MDLPARSSAFCEFLSKVSDFHTDCLDPDITWGQVESSFYSLKVNFDRITNKLIPRYELTSSVHNFNRISDYISLLEYNKFLQHKLVPSRIVITSVFDRLPDQLYLRYKTNITSVNIDKQYTRSDIESKYSLRWQSVVGGKLL